MIGYKTFKYQDSGGHNVEVDVRNVKSKNPKWPIQLCFTQHGDNRRKFAFIDIPGNLAAGFIKAISEEQT